MSWGMLHYIHHGGTMKIIKYFFGAISYLFSAVFALGCFGVIMRLLMPQPVANTGIFLFSLLIEFCVFGALSGALWKAGDYLTTKEL
jgi:hypothetical protein